MTHRDSETDFSAGVNLDRQEVKTLGIGWNPKTDKLKFVVKDLQLSVFTKRNILSRLAMLYDPLMCNNQGQSGNVRDMEKQTVWLG